MMNGGCLGSAVCSEVQEVQEVQGKPALAGAGLQ